jgi:hypothetical protein
MKFIICVFLFSFCAVAQEFQPKSNPFNFEAITLPIYYFPFYDSVQVIEIDYYTQSLAQGAMNDAMYPRGGSSYHDAMMMNRMNGYLVRNLKGEIIANYGVLNVSQLNLSAPDSCQIITHKQRLNSIKNQGHFSFQQTLKDYCGYGYLISRVFIPQKHSEMPERGVQLLGVLDTLGKIAIPMNHVSVDYTDGEYLVERYSRLVYRPLTITVKSESSDQKVENDLKRFAIYDSTFQLTFAGSDIPLKRISKNRYVKLNSGAISFIDRFGNSLQSKTYLSISDASYSDLMIYNSKRNDTIYQGLLSRQLEEVTPAIFSSIIPFEHGFKVQDAQKRNGLLNLEGKLIVPFDLEALTINYRRDKFIVFTQYVEVPNGKMQCSGLIDSAGKVLLPAVYWEIGTFYNKITTVKKDNKWGLINRSGELLCPIIYDSFGQLHRNFIEITSNGKLGLLDQSGKVVFEPNYTYLVWYDSLIHYGTENNEFFIFDYKSGATYEHNFGKLMPQVNGLSFYVEDKKYGVVSSKGKLLISAQFDKVHGYRNNRALVQQNGKYGLIDENGKIVKAVNYTGYKYDKEGNYVLE